MSATWIILSTTWDFANVQVTLNIIISLPGTIDIWTFSRFWYQDSSSKILRHEHVAFLSLFTFTSPGEAWDILLLKGNIFQSQVFPILAQAISVVLHLAQLLPQV
jgi:hypothetical protein